MSEQNQQQGMTDQQIIDILGHWGALPLREAGTPEEVTEGRTSVLTLAVHEIIRKSGGKSARDPNQTYLPCPICTGVEGCDHTYVERASAAAKTMVIEE